jgi:hypothetical protein
VQKPSLPLLLPSCHVWQKLFELRWTESPPQIMKYVNEALRGMWHEVALDETSSLVVQKIFDIVHEGITIRVSVILYLWNVIVIVEQLYAYSME